MRSAMGKIKSSFFGSRRRSIITLLIIGFIAYSLIRSSTAPDHEVESYTVKKTDFKETLTAAGEIKADRYIDLVAEIPGDITNILVKDGAMVKEGDVIAQVDSRKAYQAYEQAQADLRAREASLDYVYDTVQGSENDESFAEREARTLAESAKDRSYRALVSAQVDLSNTKITAPFTGIINFTGNVSIGSYVSTLTPSFALIDPTTVYFEAEVSEIDVSELKIGTPAVIELDAFPEETIDETVQMIGFISLTTSSGGTAYKVKIPLPDNLQNKYRIGMNGDVEFVLSTNENTISIPLSSLVENEEEYVWVINEDNTVTKRIVETGVSSLNDIQIISGLSEGENIVLRPPATMSEGQKITRKDS